MSDTWNERRLESLPRGSALLVDSYQIAAPNLGSIHVRLDNEGNDLPVMLNQFIRPPRVDVHCHLIEAFDEEKREPEPIRRIYETLINCGYQTHWKKEFTLKGIMDPWIHDECGQRPTSGNNLVGFMRFGLSNNTLRAIPYVLGAAMRAPYPFPESRIYPSYLAPIQAIAVPLVLDLSYMVLFEDDPEQITPRAEEAAFYFRDVLRSAVKKEKKLPRHLSPYFDVSVPIYLTNPSEAKLKTTLDGTAEVARQSRGSIQPFLPFDPRRWCAETRTQVPERRFDTLEEYLDCYLYARNRVCSADKPNRGYAGLKFYTRHGWQLRGNRALYGDRIGDALDEQVRFVLDEAVKNDIPITNHHSPGGTPPNGFMIPPKCMVVQNRTDVPLPPQNCQDTCSSYAKWLAWIAAAETAFLCEYVESTTSPKIWRTELKARPNLRVNLAHAGSAGAMYAHFFPAQCLLDMELVLNRLLNNGSCNDEMAYGIKLSDIEYLLTNPVVVQQDLFAEAFWNATKLRLHRYCSQHLGNKLSRTPPMRFTYPLAGEFRKLWERMIEQEIEHLRSFHEDSSALKDLRPSTELGNFLIGGRGTVFDELAKLQSDTLWQGWLKDWWKKIYPGANEKTNWFGSILELAEQYENVYVDFSYATGQRSMLAGANNNDQRIIANLVIPTALRRMMVDQTLSRKAMFGSDWFLIEQDLGSADDAWTFFRKCFEVAKLSDLHWELFSSFNAIDFLNLRTRRNAIKAFVGGGPNKDKPLRSVVAIPENKIIDDALVPRMRSRQRFFHGYIESEDAWKFRVGAREICSNSGVVNATIDGAQDQRIVLPNGQSVAVTTDTQPFDDINLYVGTMNVDIPEPQISIAKSVGRKGVNEERDVKVVQHLLAEHLLSPGRFDGVADEPTFKAIELFQRVTFGWDNPDGRVDPKGPTIQALAINKGNPLGECVEKVVLNVTDICGKRPYSSGPVDADSEIVELFHKQLLDTGKKLRDVYKEVKEFPQNIEEMKSWFRTKIKPHAYIVTVVQKHIFLTVYTTTSRLIYLRTVLQYSIQWSLRYVRTVSWSASFSGIKKMAVAAIKTNIIFTTGTALVEEMLLEEELCTIRLLSTVAYDLARGLLLAMLQGLFYLAAAAAATTLGSVASVVIVVGGFAVCIYLTVTEPDNQLRDAVRKNAAPIFDSFIKKLTPGVQSVVDSTKWCFTNQAQCLLPLYLHSVGAAR